MFGKEYCGIENEGKVYLEQKKLTQEFKKKKNRFRNKENCRGICAKLLSLSFPLIQTKH